MQVALDGRIVSGEANVSTEHITGEAVPVRKGTGDELPSGARVEDGALVVKATRPASESTIARIAQLSRQAKVVQSSLALCHALLLSRLASKVLTHTMDWLSASKISAPV